MDALRFPYVISSGTQEEFGSMAHLLTRFAALLVGVGVAFSLVACGLALPGTAGPVAPCSVTNSKQAADAFLQRMQTLSANKGKPVTVTATDQEISSVLNEAIQQAQQNTPGGVVPLENPVVCFKNGQMTIFGTVNAAGMSSLNALLTVSASLNNGKASFMVDQVQVGPVSVPQGLGDAVSGLINEALSQSLDQIHLTRITIGNDRITLQGTFQ
jgi:hypothetical protein